MDQFSIPTDTNENNLSNIIIDSDIELKESNFFKTAKEVRFVLDSQQYTERAPISVSVKGKRFGIPLDAGKTFENFIIGSSNEMAFRASKEIVTAPGKKGKYPSLYLYSSSGLGKTHLLHATANEISKKWPELSICIITARDFMQDMIEAIKTNTKRDFQRKYCEQIDVLMIDDIHELAGKKGTQNEFFHVFNALYDNGKQLIFTSDKKPTEITGLEERISSRLQWGVVVEIQKPDLDTRIEILRAKGQEKELALSDDVMNLLAISLDSSVRELEGALTKLSAYAEIMNVNINVPIAKQQLGIQNSDYGAGVTIDRIMRVAAEYFNVSVADIKSADRRKDVASARRAAMFLSSHLTKHTVTEIGKQYKRHYSTVLSSISKVKRERSRDRELSRALLFIENNL